ncbi:dihydroxyacetonephosphate acyltransferase [Novymonas esmeraldas]|uniref:Dihydroxyacetonephosphate acyltransferase n=1 Tax=Novymonas esmeraldas TaxID=1808958 RepID=A0AAW0EV72_9TRYP
MATTRSISSAPLALPEEGKRVVLMGPIDSLTATCACALATSPFVPPTYRILVSGLPRQRHASLDTHTSLSPASSADGAAVLAREFMGTVQQVGVKMRESRAVRRESSATHMTQVFYGGVSPTAEEIGPMLRRVELLRCGTAGEERANAAAAGATSAEVMAPGELAAASWVADSVFVLVLTAQSLGEDADDGLTACNAVLRRLWCADGAAPSPRLRGSLIILADDVYRSAVCALLSRIAGEVATPVDWSVLLAYAHAMDPPALEFGAAEVAVHAATGVSHGGTLPALCAGTALGALRHFPVGRSEPATLTPVDVAMNAALLGSIWLRHGELPTCIECATDMQYRGAAPAEAGVDAPPSPQPQRCCTQHRVASFAVAESRKPGETSLVWGMVGEYLMGYYGRFARHITAAFPVADVLTSAPILQFPFSVADILNFGPEPRAVAYAWEGWRASQQRQRLLELRSGAGAGAARELRACVVHMDNAVRGVQRVAREAAVREKELAAAAAAASRRRDAVSTFSVPPYRLDDFHTALYHSLLRRTTAHYPHMPYHQCVALAEVDWEAYVSVIARAVLVHLAQCALQDRQQLWSRLGAPPTASIAELAGVARGAATPPVPPSAAAVEAPAPFAFPEPRRGFTNELVYAGDERIPPFPSQARELFHCTAFLHRAGLTANGWRSDMTPGMTPQVLASILAQPDMQRLITALAAKDGASKSEVVAQARRILLQCGDTLNHVQGRFTGLLVREVFRRIYGRVDINGGAYERAHRYFAMPRVAVVFAPLHRSYVDFLIMSEVLALLRLPLPHIVAGDNFLNLGAVATLMRGSGAFFMRRSFRGDPLYAALFRAYVRHLVRARRPLEFFIEGMRSRTGKTMAPKMGLLKFVCDTFYEPGQRELDDVLIVPVSLSYDELLEATMYAKELLGVPKPKETVMNMLKARSLLDRMHGNVNIHMGEPVSLRSIRAHPRQCPLPYQPRCEQQVGGEVDTNGGAAAAVAVAEAEAAAAASLDTTPSMEKSSVITPAPLLATVAWHLMYRLQHNTVITPASMVAAVVECLGAYHGAAMPLAKVQEGVEWLRGVLRERGARLSAEAAEWSGDRLVTLALSHLQRYVRLADDAAAVTYHPDDVVSRTAVNISTNQLIHVCVDEALVAAVAQAFGSPVGPHQPAPAADGGAMPCGVRVIKADVLSNQTQLLQRLLSVEFPSFAAAAPVSFASWLDCTVSRLQQQRGEDCKAVDKRAGAEASSSGGGAAVVHLPVTQYHYFLLQLLCPHIEALYAVLVATSALLTTYPGLPLGAADVVTATQRACGALYAAGKLRYIVAANKETLLHYFESLIALSLLQLKRRPAPASSRKASGGDVVVYVVGAVGQEAALARVAVLAAQVQALWWHPTAASSGATVDTAALRERVLADYRELTQPSKM